jgi:hypothetical protein
MSWCKTCGDYMLFPDSHKCPPIWECWCPDEGETRDDPRMIRASDAEAAAEKWAEEDDRYGDYTIIGGNDATVCVAKPDNDEVRTFVVTGESVPEYHAEEKI